MVVPLIERSPIPNGIKLGSSGHDAAALPLAPPPLSSHWNLLRRCSCCVVRASISRVSQKPKQKTSQRFNETWLIIGYLLYQLTHLSFFCKTFSLSSRWCFGISLSFFLFRTLIFICLSVFCLLLSHFDLPIPFLSFLFFPPVRTLRVCFYCFSLTIPILHFLLLLLLSISSFFSQVLKSHFSIIARIVFFPTWRDRNRKLFLFNQRWISFSNTKNCCIVIELISTRFVGFFDCRLPIRMIGR